MVFSAALSKASIELLGLEQISPQAQEPCNNPSLFLPTSSITPLALAMKG